MKKVIFALLVVLLAMLAITCDSVVMPQKSSTAALTAADSDFVTIGINIADDRSRAMTKSNAQTIVGGTDGFYEVVFVRSSATPNMTVRDSADAAKFAGGWKVTVPRGSYTPANTTDQAVLFVGNKTDKTLLAIGVLTVAADFTTPASQPSGVTFALTAITSELVSGSASSFNISLAGYNVQSAGAGETIELVTNPLVHQIPKGTTGINATYTFGGLTGGVVSLAQNDYPFIKAASITDGVSLDINSVNPIPATLTAPTQAIQFVFDTSNTTGYAKIYVEVPVFAINKLKSDDYGKPEAIMWYIRGGVNNKKVDSGGAASAVNDGGAVLIELYDPNVVGGVDVNTPTWP
jgi:hypothetical protein